MKLKPGTEYSLIYENAPFPYIGALQAIEIETASLIFIISGREVIIPLSDIQSKKIQVELKPQSKEKTQGNQSDPTDELIAMASERIEISDLVNKNNHPGVPKLETKTRIIKM